MKWAVLGATGQLGSAVCALLGSDAIGVTRSELDLQVLADVEPFIAGLDVAAVVNCAAYTAVDAAETDRDRANAINGLAVGELSRVCGERGIALTTFSTDYVFDGTKPGPYVESDEPNPQSAYGRSKLMGEALALQGNPRTLVIRTSWVLSGTHPNFAATMIRLIAEGPVEVVDDQVGRPTMAADLAPAAIAATVGGVNGVLHLANEGAVSWFQLAREIAEIAGLDPAVVKPCRTEDHPRPAPRPANSVLDSERLGDLGMEGLPHYGESLQAAVRALVPS